jgi:signal transduction histidine kinase
MNLKGKASLYFIIATSLPLIAMVVILYFYLIGGLQRIEIDNISVALTTVKSHFEKEGDNITQRVDRAMRADDYQMLQILMTRDRQGRIDQSKLIDLTGEYRKLLKLDFLEVISPASMILASGARPADFNRETDFRFIGDIIDQGRVLGFTNYNAGDKNHLSYASGQALLYEDSLIAVFVGGIFLDSYYLQNLNLPYNVQLAILAGKDLRASTMGPANESRLNEELGKRRSAEDLAKNYKLDDISYRSYFQQLYSLDENSYFQAMLLYPPSFARLLTAQSFKIYSVVALAGVLISGLLGYAFAQKLSGPIRELSRAADGISRGKFDHKIIWFSNDEMGTLVDGFNHMYDRLKRSQQRLIQAEKLAAWNQMARKIAHEIKNPLTPIKISIEDLRRSYHKDEKEYPLILENAADTIITEIDKLKRIVDEFSSFAKLPSPDLKKANPASLIEKSLKLYRNLIDEGKIIIKKADNLPDIKADQGLFSQALVNLVKNALEADPSGPIEISLSADSESVIITVRDHGQGIEDKLLPQIFTPYFTTKREGVGLGLVIAQRIVFDHEGEISVNSNTETGTEFTIKLPIAG